MATSRRAGTNEQITTYGTGKTYTEGNFATWEQATDTDHVADTETDVLEVYAEGGGGGLWDDAEILGGSTNGVVNSFLYCRIVRAASGEGHSGIPKDDGSMAGFRHTGNLFHIDETYTQLQDLVLQGGLNHADDRYAVYLAADETKIIGCLIFDCNNAGAGGVNGIRFAPGAGNTGYVINCLFHNIDLYAMDVLTGDNIAYNCTENTSVSGALFIGNGDTMTTINCVLDSGITNNGTHNTTTDTIDTPTYIDSVNNDFHLAANDVTAKDQGTDLSGDGTFAFDDDINDGVMGAGKAGETRSGTWDIGFDEIVAAVEDNLKKTTYYYNMLKAAEVAIQ